jgi:hypothetical protein
MRFLCCALCFPAFPPRLVHPLHAPQAGGHRLVNPTWVCLISTCRFLCTLTKLTPRGVIHTVLPMASLVEAYQGPSGYPPPQNLCMCPRPPATAFPRVCTYKSSLLVALWLAGRTNPSHSAYSDTCRLLLQLWPCFLVATSVTSLPTLPGYLDSQAPGSPCTDSTWCYSRMTTPRSAVFCPQSSQAAQRLLFFYVCEHVLEWPYPRTHLGWPARPLR